MLTLHIVDYTVPDARIAQLVAQIVDRLPEAEFAVSVVSYGESLSRYGALLQQRKRPASLVETPTLGHRFAVACGPDATFLGRTTYEVLADSFAAADLIWFPSVHDHLFDGRLMANTVASFHDPSGVELAEFSAEKSDPAGAATCTGMAAIADMATRRLMTSLAGVAAGSARIADYLAETYRPKFRRPRAIPLPSGTLLSERAVPLALPPVPYIVYDGSTAALGNHETLLMALAQLKQAGSPLRLALAGAGTDRIADGEEHRSAYLRALAAHLALELGSDIHLYGPLSPGERRSLYSQAAGAVLPAVAEGEAMIAGAQALELGLPLACADLPGLRGYFIGRGATPLWFSPAAPEEAATALQRLADTPHTAQLALGDVGWDETAQSYLTMFREQAILASAQSGGR